MPKKVDHNKILQLNIDGKNNKEISIILNCSTTVVHKVLKKNNLRSANPLPDKINIINDTEAICRICGLTKTLDNFSSYLTQNKIRVQEYKKRSYCNECRQHRIIDNLNSSNDKSLRDKFIGCRSRANIKNIKFSISYEYFYSLYELQNGRCFYTGDELVLTRGLGLHKNVLSLDRIVPEKGYIEGNVVFCTFRVNTIKNNLTLTELKNWIPTWYVKIIEKIGEYNE